MKKIMIVLFFSFSMSHATIVGITNYITISAVLAKVPKAVIKRYKKKTKIAFAGLLVELNTKVKGNLERLRLTSSLRILTRKTLKEKQKTYRALIRARKLLESELSTSNISKNAQIHQKFE